MPHVTYDRSEFRKYISNVFSILFHCVFSIEDMLFISCQQLHIFHSTFRMMVTPPERRAIEKALRDYHALNKHEMTQLNNLFGACTWSALPNGGNFRQQILDIAEDQMVDKPSKLVAHMRKGIPENHMLQFWSQLTSSSITHLFMMQRPRAEAVVDVINEPADYYMKPEEENSLYFFKQYVLSLDQEDLSKVLQYITGSSAMPDSITVIFNATSGIMRHPTAHTCSNTLDLPSTYSSVQDLKREFNSILYHDSSVHTSSFAMSAI